MPEVLVKPECEVCLIDASLFIMQDFISTDKKKKLTCVNCLTFTLQDTISGNE